jgi:hypothetical protein
MGWQPTRRATGQTVVRALRTDHGSRHHHFARLRWRTRRVQRATAENPEGLPRSALHHGSW